MPLFNGSEAANIAVEMERRGESFYLSCAKITKNAEAAAVYERLAADERAHAQEFIRLRERLGNEPFSEEAGAYLSAIAADIVFPGGLMAVAADGFDTPEGAVREAMRSEKDSIMFYTGLKALTKDESAVKTLDDIIKQEQSHLLILSRRLEKIGG